MYEAKPSQVWLVPLMAPKQRHTRSCVFQKHQHAGQVEACTWPHCTALIHYWSQAKPSLVVPKLAPKLLHCSRTATCGSGGGMYLADIQCPPPPLKPSQVWLVPLMAPKTTAHPHLCAEVVQSVRENHRCLMAALRST